MTQTTLINDIYGVVGSKGEITDFNIDGKNVGLVRVATSPGGGLELRPRISVARSAKLRSKRRLVLGQRSSDRALRAATTLRSGSTEQA